MKAIAAFLLLACVEFSFGQIDTNLIATGDWSESVRDKDGHALRGRLLVFDDQTTSAANHARVYLELQNVFVGGWSGPLEIYFDMRSDLRFELHDALNSPIPEEPIAIRGPMPYPYHVILPCDSTIRLRVDIYTLGPRARPNGLEIFVSGGCWMVLPSATNDSFLSATLLPPKDHPAPLKPRDRIWQEELKLPAVRIAVKKK